MINQRLKDAVDKIFNEDMQAMEACTRFWGRDPNDAPPNMPTWARERVEVIMREEGIPGDWLAGFDMVLNADN